MVHKLVYHTYMALKIHVSETFYSIQGEGRTVGVPAVFLRLQGCNLNCGQRSGTWVCDTVDVWKTGNTHSVEVFFQLMVAEYGSAFNSGAHLVITGGEPLLQQRAIGAFLGLFNQRPIIEIETNGTIVPSDELLCVIDYWNVSPKFSNSGEIRHLNTDLLQMLSQYSGTTFKFVVSNEADVLEVVGALPWLADMPIRSKCLMPAAECKKTLEHQYTGIIALAKQYGFRLSQRLHLSVWDKKTGV